MTSYPPQPWRLHGQAYVSVWRLPVGRLRAAMPPGVQPVTVRGQAVVGTAWVDYQPGGVLSYRELLAAVLVRSGAWPAVTITEIWVDSTRSLAGGRELWGIPKQLARLAMADGGASAEDARGVIASARLRRRAGPPLRLPARITVVQQSSGGILRTPVRATGHVHAAQVRWRLDPAGPLGYLHGLQPTVSFALRDFRLRFGS